MSESKSSHKLNYESSHKNYIGFRSEIQPLKSKEKDVDDPKKRIKCEDFEEVLNLVGSQGKFQKKFLYGVITPFVTIAPILLLNSIFILDVPDHWCHVPGSPDLDSNVTDLQFWKNLTLPIEIGPDGHERFSQCKMYDPDSLNNVTECQFGWDYDKTDYESTIPSEFNWVCENVNYATDCFTWSNVGSAIGTVLFGILADKYGRKPMLFASCFVMILFKFLSLFVPQYFKIFLIFQFLGGTAFPALFSLSCLLGAEICGPDYRSWTYAVVWMVWVVGNCLLPLVAWVARGWFLIGCLTLLPGALLLLYYPIIHESPRWLISVGRGDEALKILFKMSKTNGTADKLDRDEIGRMVEDLIDKQKEDHVDRNVGVWTLFQSLGLATNTILLCIVWSMNMLLYYGIMLNTTSMAGNKFLNYLLLNFIELPSGYLAGVLVDKTGRRWTQSGFFFLCVISCIICASTVANPELSYLVILGALGIKLGVSITSLVVYLQGAEIFPTQLRSTGSGLASTMSSFLGITGPYIVFTGKLNVAVPYVILGVLSVIGVVASACLPETFRQNLPETIEEANVFGKDKKFWSYLPIDKSRNNNNNKQNAP